MSDQKTIKVAKRAACPEVDDNTPREELDSEHEIIAEALAKDLKLMIRNEIDARFDNFLEREQSELKDLFAKVKEEESGRLEIMIEGIKSHTDRIKAEFTGIKDLPFETS